MFEDLIWEPDRILLGDLVFRIQRRGELPGANEDSFALYKDRPLLDEFDRFWTSTPFRPRRILEIGIWDGASAALWFEHLRPQRLAAIDIGDREDNAYFRRYVERNELQGRLFTHWRTDQADRAALLRIVEDDLGGALDCVIDDGSHLYEPTKASFEALFPLLPPGGLYIIEDWAWEHWPEFQDAGNFWALRDSASPLLNEITAAMGSSPGLARTITVCAGFAVIERGDAAVGGDFKLADHIVRRPWRAAATAKQPEEEDVKVFAFYLPQFHPIPENDRWWGKGYTEWARVARGRPQYAGHYQPHLPERLGFYDLRLPETRQRQAELARSHGVSGFCYYYYSFGAKTLLDRPLIEMLESGAPDMPFCLCWANENWTRRWDGDERALLIEQRYGPELDVALIEDLIPFFRDRRYLRVRGAPVLIVYYPTAIPEPHATVARWRRVARAHGLPGLHLVAALTFGLTDPRPLGFDAGLEFPPHGEIFPDVLCTPEGVHPDFSGRIVDYHTVMQRQLARAPRPFRAYRTAMAGWDNSARLGKHGTIFHGSSPEAYEQWMRALVTEARLGHPDHRLVFVNAWNEWAEGAHLEPDQRFGTGYLEATQRALTPA